MSRSSAAEGDESNRNPWNSILQVGLALLDGFRNPTEETSAGRMQPNGPRSDANCSLHPSYPWHTHPPSILIAFNIVSTFHLFIYIVASCKFAHKSNQYKLHL